MSFALDPLSSYLICANALTFALGVVDSFLRLRPGGTGIRSLPFCALSVAGGALGTLSALLLWNRKVSKDNALSYVVAISSLVVWAVALGFLYVCPFDSHAFVANLATFPAIPLAYLSLANLLTFVCFAVDKRRAVRGAWRIREATLLGLSLAGGVVGGLLAMVLLRHKIRSPQFRYGMPFTLVAWLALAAFVVNAGVFA